MTLRRRGRRPACLAAALPALGLAAVARAEPTFAVREGYPCSQCHVNRTGGGKRTEFGAIYAQTALPLSPAPDPAGAGTFVDPHLGEFLSLGAALRVDARWQRAQPGCHRAEGARRWRCGQEPPADPPPAEVVEPAEARAAFEIAQANLYLQADLVRDRALLYLDLEAAGGAREALLVAQDLGGPAHLYLKAGRMLLPYGLRLLDDTAFVRQPTGANYSIRETGLEVGAEPGPAQVSLAYTNGFEARFPNRWTASASLVGRPLPWARARAGVSASYSRYRPEAATGKEPPNFTSVKAGAHAGLSVGRLSLLGEIDRVRDRPGRFQETEGQQLLEQQVALAQLDVLAARGLNLRVAYDHWDPDLATPRDRRERLVLAVDLFPWPLVQVSGVYRAARDIPQRVQGNVDELIVQVHGFL